MCATPPKMEHNHIWIGYKRQHDFASRRLCEQCQSSADRLGTHSFFEHVHAICVNDYAPFIILQRFLFSPKLDIVDLWHVICEYIYRKPANSRQETHSPFSWAKYQVSTGSASDLYMRGVSYYKLLCINTPRSQEFTNTRGKNHFCLCIGLDLRITEFDKTIQLQWHVSVCKANATTTATVCTGAGMNQS